MRRGWREEGKGIEIGRVRDGMGRGGYRDRDGMGTGWGWGPLRVVS